MLAEGCVGCGGCCSGLGLSFVAFEEVRDLVEAFAEVVAGFVDFAVWVRGVACWG